MSDVASCTAFRYLQRIVALIAVFFAVFAVSSAKQSIASGGWLEHIPPGIVKVDFLRKHPIFYVGEPITFKVMGSADKFVKYIVRNYYGEVVEKGDVDVVSTLKSLAPGWYKIYIESKQEAGSKENLVGGSTFVVFRNRSGFPKLPAKEISNGSYPNMDVPVRGVLGMGPDRLHVRDAAKPAESIKLLNLDVDLNKQFYLPFDPARKRSLLLAFPNGTTSKLDGVQEIVRSLKKDVQYFEPRNEPNGGSNGADFARQEMKPFFNTIKQVDPTLKVLGPGTVSIGPQLLPWLEDFLKAGGASSIDGFSFHAYNTVNGDLALARKALDSLNALLTKYNAGRLEKWQTEQGYMAAMYGVYAPRHQGRWTMLQMMVYEQYGIPKEHNVYFYDRSHGYWDVPTWWENDDNSLNPAAALMRVWSEELYGTNFRKAYDFGEPGNKLYIGSLFSGPDKQIAAFMSAGSTDGHVDLNVSSGTVLHTISAFGQELSLPVKNGRVILLVPELPVYVDLQKGQTIEVVPTAWGANLARLPGVKLSVPSPSVPSSAQGNTGKDCLKDLDKINNGELENWYWSQTPDSGAWTVSKPELPFSVGLKFPQLTLLSRVLVYASPPWQSQGSLLDYELQYEKNGRWITVERVSEPTKSFSVITPATRTTVDTYYSDRWVFQQHFKPVQTTGIRLLIHDSTWGGAATREVYEAGGQASEQNIVIREIEAYGK